MSYVLMLLLASMPTQSLEFQRRQINKMIRERGNRRITPKKRTRLVENFLLYGRIWGVNPILAACIGWKESSFREHIRVGGAGEIGIMQVIPWEKSTRDGYRKCTGRKKRATWRQLRYYETNICVGIYELREKRRFVQRYINWYKKRNRLRYCKWHNPRYWSWRHRRLFKKYPHLQKYFWVASYNWGPRIFTHSRSRWDPVGYPIRVLKCFQKYGGFPVKKERNIYTATVRFETGKRRVDKTKRNSLELSMWMLARSLRENSGLKVRITGYTDSIGGWSYNKRLSRNRAKRIWDLLLKYGAPKNRVKYLGKGERNPVATNRTKQGRSLNRRVEIEVYQVVVVKRQ